VKIETVQRWVASVILIHVGGAPAVTLAAYSTNLVDADYGKGVGLWVMSGVVGLVTAGGVLLIFQRSLLSPWLVPGALPAAISAFFIF
jgi:hypothetical protein